MDPFFAGVALDGSTCTFSACNLALANWAYVDCSWPRVAFYVSGKCKEKGNDYRIVISLSVKNGIGLQPCGKRRTTRFGPGPFPVGRGDGLGLPLEGGPKSNLDSCSSSVGRCRFGWGGLPGPPVAAPPRAGFPLAPGGV